MYGGKWPQGLLLVLHGLYKVPGVERVLEPQNVRLKVTTYDEILICWIFFLLLDISHRFADSKGRKPDIGSLVEQDLHICPHENCLEVSRASKNVTHIL